MILCRFMLSVCVQGETDTLQHPVGNVPCGIKVGFKNQATAHGVPSQGGRVHGGPERVLKEDGGRRALSVKSSVKLGTRRASGAGNCLQKCILFSLSLK